MRVSALPDPASAGKRRQDRLGVGAPARQAGPKGVRPDRRGPPRDHSAAGPLETVRRLRQSDTHSHHPGGQPWLILLSKTQWKSFWLMLSADCAGIYRAIKRRSCSMKRGGISSSALKSSSRAVWRSPMHGRLRSRRSASARHGPKLSSTGRVPRTGRAPISGGRVGRRHSRYRSRSDLIWTTRILLGMERPFDKPMAQYRLMDGEHRFGRSVVLSSSKRRPLNPLRCDRYRTGRLLCRRPSNGMADPAKWRTYG